MSLNSNNETAKASPPPSNDGATTSRDADKSSHDPTATAKLPNSSRKRGPKPTPDWAFLMNAGSKRAKRQRVSPTASTTKAPGKSPAHRAREQRRSSPRKTARKTSSASPKSRSPTPEATPEMPLRVHHRSGDLFACAPGSVLVHACNCLGSWGAGVALTFKQRYPRAFRIYADYCRSHARNPSSLVGTALLIPPQPARKGREREDWIGCLFTRENYGKVKGKSQLRDVEEILEATGEAWGRLLREIRGIEDEEGGEAGIEVGEVREDGAGGLKGDGEGKDKGDGEGKDKGDGEGKDKGDGEGKQRSEGGGEQGKGRKIGELVLPKINGGLFKVPWAKTEEVLRTGGEGWEDGTRAECFVYSG